MADVVQPSARDVIAGTPFEGRHAVVTGASRGIGAAVAETLARLGARLTLLARNEARLAERRRDLAGRFGATVAALAADVADPASVERAMAAAADRFGAPAILVNNAGIAESAPFARTGLDQWRRILQTNLTGTFLCARAVYPAMVEAGYGRIVNVASTSGLKGYAYVAAYCASKHGVVGLTRALALEAARTGVTVNAVCPGFTETDILRRAVDNIAAKTGRSEDRARAELAAANPQGRIVQPWEVAETVAWLCLPASSSINGQSVALAGGEVT